VAAAAVAAAAAAVAAAAAAAAAAGSRSSSLLTRNASLRCLAAVLAVAGPLGRQEEKADVSRCAHKLSKKRVNFR